MRRRRRRRRVRIRRGRRRRICRRRDGRRCVRGVRYRGRRGPAGFRRRVRRLRPGCLVPGGDRGPDPQCHRQPADPRHIRRIRHHYPQHAFIREHPPCAQTYRRSFARTSSPRSVWRPRGRVHPGMAKNMPCRWGRRRAAPQKPMSSTFAPGHRIHDQMSWQRIFVHYAGDLVKRVLSSASCHEAV